VERGEPEATSTITPMASTIAIPAW